MKKTTGDFVFAKSTFARDKVAARTELFIGKIRKGWK
jgi:hypothetical protein